MLSPAESTDLDIILDDAIVEAARKRCIYPKRILPHVVHAFKAERKLMVGLQKLPDLLICTQLRKPTGPESKQEIPHILLCFEPIEIHALVRLFGLFVPLYVLCVFQGLYENAVKPEDVVKDPDEGCSSLLSCCFYCHCCGFQLQEFKRIFSHCYFHPFEQETS